MNISAILILLLLTFVVLLEFALCKVSKQAEERDEEMRRKYRETKDE